MNFPQSLLRINQSENLNLEGFQDITLSSNDMSKSIYIGLCNELQLGLGCKVSN